MGFPRQDYWSVLPFPSQGDCPNPGIKPRSPALQADSLPTEPSGKPNICMMKYILYNYYKLFSFITHLYYSLVIAMFVFKITYVTYLLHVFHENVVKMAKKSAQKS